MFSNIESRRDVLRFSDRKAGKSEGVTWIVKAARLRLFIFQSGGSDNIEFEESPKNLDFQIVGKIMVTKG